MNNFYIFVEGYYDLMFVENVLSIFLLEKFSYIVYPIPYAQKSKKFINKEIKSKSKHKFLLFADLDINDYSCITKKKNYLINLYSNLKLNDVIIVKEEIESWFLAGMDTSIDLFKSFKIPDKTDVITKEDFNQMLLNNSKLNKEDFLLELSHSFNFDLAVKRNDSFKYFLNKLKNMA